MPGQCLCQTNMSDVMVLGPVARQTGRNLSLQYNNWSRRRRTETLCIFVPDSASSPYMTWSELEYEPDSANEDWSSETAVERSDDMPGTSESDRPGDAVYDSFDNDQYGDYVAACMSDPTAMWTAISCLIQTCPTLRTRNCLTRMPGKHEIWSRHTRRP